MAGFGRQHRLCVARPPERQARGIAVCRGNRFGEMAAGGSSCRAIPLLHAAGHCVSSRRSDQPKGRRSVDRKQLRSGDHRRRPPPPHRPLERRLSRPDIDADNLSAMPAIARHLRATRFIDPRTIVVSVGRRVRAHWVSELAHLLAFQAPLPGNPSGRPLGGNALDDPKILEGRPPCWSTTSFHSGGTMQACARAVHFGRRRPFEAIVTHALFPPGSSRSSPRPASDLSDPTTSVPHCTATITLDSFCRTPCSRNGRCKSRGVPS